MHSRPALSLSGSLRFVIQQARAQPCPKQLWCSTTPSCKQPAGGFRMLQCCAGPKPGGTGHQHQAPQHARAQHSLSSPASRSGPPAKRARSATAAAEQEARASSSAAASLLVADDDGIEPASMDDDMGHAGPGRRNNKHIKDLVDRQPTVIGDVAASMGGVARVVVRRGKSRLFRDGQPLVFAGAIERVVGKPAPVAGDCVVVTNGIEQPIGWGVYNPASLFRVRMMQLEEEAARDRASVLDMGRLVASRIAAAAALRAALGLPSAATTVYRLVNSEGDRLSGLVVDVLGNRAVVASSSAWAERYQADIRAALARVLPRHDVVWRPNADLLHREEGVPLPSSDDTAAASSTVDPEQAAPEQSLAVRVLENGACFLASAAGQKTGFYADQRDSRLLLRGLVAGRSVLDLCCYSGGFAVMAALGGASAVVGVDSSGVAIELARQNAELNGVSAETCLFEKEDIVAHMQDALARGEQWDVVVLDPPKLAPSRKVLEKAARRYRKYNALAMKLVVPGGLLMTCSCSGAMTQSGLFLLMLQEAARLAGREITVLRTAGAGPDHPLEPAYPEGNYLTNVLLRVL